jgi:hypothetical protein
MRPTEAEGDRAEEAAELGGGLGSPATRRTVASGEWRVALATGRPFPNSNGPPHRKRNLVAAANADRGSALGPAASASDPLSLPRQILPPIGKKKYRMIFFPIEVLFGNNP